MVHCGSGLAPRIEGKALAHALQPKAFPNPVTRPRTIQRLAWSIVGAGLPAIEGKALAHALQP